MPSERRGLARDALVGIPDRRGYLTPRPLRGGTVRVVTERKEQSVDLLVIGAGIAGLWILDAAVRAGLRAVAVECDALGAGQSVSAQGIIHGGLKYTLREKDLASAGSIRDMPGQWRALHEQPEAGGPDLRTATMSSPCTWLWRTDSLASRIGMLGARATLRTRPEAAAAADRPSLLRSVPGAVLRVGEPVFDTRSALAALASPHRDRLVRVGGPEGVELTSRAGLVDRAILRDGPREITLRPRAVVLAAGTGNEALLSRMGLDANITQRRPLHMTLLRGSDLPMLHGHCVDGNRTRVTVTSGRDRAGRVVWQLGGDLAETGVERDQDAQIRRAVRELTAVLPDLDPRSIEDAAWSTYRVDRAERRTGAGLRPDDATVERLHEGRLLVAWPTKWALAPRLAARVLESLPPSPGVDRPESPLDLRPMETPDVAEFPWETRTWIPHRDVLSAEPA